MVYHRKACVLCDCKHWYTLWDCVTSRWSLTHANLQFILFLIIQNCEENVLRHSCLKNHNTAAMISKGGQSLTVALCYGTWACVAMGKVEAIFSVRET
jgi:hypothetical protein